MSTTVPGQPVFRRERRQFVVQWGELRSARQPPEKQKDICWHIGSHVDHLAWLHLCHEGSQRITVSAVLNSPHEHLRRGAIYEAHRKARSSVCTWCSVLAEVQVHHIPSTGTTDHLRVDDGAFGEYLARLTLYASHSASVPLLVLLHSLHLLYNHNLVACRHQLLCILMLGHLWETHVRLLLTHPFETACAIGKESVVVK
mmetsp:Transcript_74550/g.129292  ORF Transcript_74550/g.129292 Transcript_74550/m.129292 type:complete len:200 (+) Transcript_74550:1302-1901(+)